MTIDFRTTLRTFWKRPVFWLIAGISLFVIYMGASVWFRHQNLYTAQFDLGNMDQVLWQSLHGRWFQMMDPGSATLINRASIHADFLLLIYLPFYAIWTSPLTLLFGQVIAVASGAIPLYLLARKRIGVTATLPLALLYLLYPALLWATLFDVHAVVLVTPLVLWLWWAVEQRRWKLATTMLVLALLGKEEVGLVLALNGIYWLWRKTTRRFGILAVVLGIGWSLLMIGWAIPQARQAPGHFALGYYAAYGQTTGQVASTVITKPWLIIRDMLRPQALSYYVRVGLPLGGFSLLGLPVFLIALPELAINTLSNNANLRTIFFQYTSVITPYVFLSALIGWAWWRNFLTRRQVRWWRPTTERWYVVLMLSLSLFSIWRWAPLPGLRNTRDAVQVFTASPYRSDINAIKLLVRPEERLAVTNNVAPQFTQRDQIWGFPNHLDRADGIVVLTGGDYELVPKESIAQQVQELLNDKNWTTVYQRQDIYFFRRAQ